MIYLSIILATLCIQIPNIWAIKYFNENPDWKSAFFIAFITIPVTFLSTAFYAYFYGKGYQEFNYPTMAVMAYGFSLLTSFSIQYFILRTKTFDIYEIMGVILILIGLCLIIFKK